MAEEDDDAWGSFVSSTPARPEPDPNPPRDDPGHGKFRKPNGALPLSLFGEVDQDGVDGGGNVDKIESGSGSGFNFGGSGSDMNLGNDDDDDDEWEFKDALQEQGGVGVAGSKVESTAPAGALDMQAGQDTSNSVEHKPGISSFFPQSEDLFVASNRAVNTSTGTHVEFKSILDALPGVQEIGTRSGISIPTTNSVEQKPSNSSLHSNDIFAASLGTAYTTKETGFGHSLTAGMINGYMFDAFPGVQEISSQSRISANSAERKLGFSNSFPQSKDLFASSHGAVNTSKERDVGVSSTTGMTNGYIFDPFSQEIGTGSGISFTAPNSVEQKPGFSSFFPESNDLFAIPHGANNTSRETDAGHKSTTTTTNGLLFDACPAFQAIGTGSGTSATAANSIEQKPGLSSSLPQSNDLFAASHGARPSDLNVGFGQTTVMTNGFQFDAFPGVKEIGYGNGVSGTDLSVDEDDDFNDFGDFIDASQAVGSKQELEQVVPDMTPVEAQDKQSQPGSGRGALPLSLFSDGTEESSDSLNQEDELVHKPTTDSGSSFSGQGSVASINDLLSNLYSQAPSISSAISNGESAKKEVHYPEEKLDTHPLSGDDDWDDNSWEFKDAYSETGVVEQPSCANPKNMAQKNFETTSDSQIYINFYAKLKDSLCFLLSCQLDQLKKAQSLDTVTDYGEKPESPSIEIEKALKLLEESMIHQEVPSRKDLDRSSCFNEVFEILLGAKFRIIESEYSLSKKLQLAADEWRVGADLLRHAISVLKILSWGAADDHYFYVSTWCKITDICTQELRHGALIWKMATDKKVQNQVLSDGRGQQYFRALGEIYKVVELLRLSAKVYKPWMFVSLPDPSLFFGLLDECGALWSSSGLQEALQITSDNVDTGCDEAVKQLIASIKNICDVDELILHDCSFVGDKPICRISLLPQDMLPDLKTVSWNGELYFLNLANLWANLISCDPPQLPHLQVS